MLKRVMIYLVLSAYCILPTSRGHWPRLSGVESNV
jgi:hypothetical protein